MKPHRAGDGERTLAVFIDFENLGLGFGNRRDRFNIERVLERLVEKGKIVAKKAYADWSRFGNYASSLHAAAVELIEIPKRSQTGKNSADIRMCVDAMDLAYSKDHIDTFVVVSGDSDFSPLVSKLKELGKHVIGLGLADSTSDLLRDNCDEFIYYEDLDRAPNAPQLDEGMPDIKKKAFNLLLDSLLALRRENKETMYASMVKDTMKRKKPSFNEEYYGYRTFSDLLEDAQRFGIVDLERHKTNGMYVITRFGAEQRTAAIPAALPPAKPVLMLPPKPAVAVIPPTPVQAPTPPPAPNIVRPPVRPNVVADPRAGELRRPPVRPIEQPPHSRPVVHARRPAPEPDPVDDDRLPLGRALIDDVDILDDDDDVPSYMPRKPTPEAKAPVGKAPAKAAAKPAAKPAEKPKPRVAAEKPPAKPRQAGRTPTPRTPKVETPVAVQPPAVPTPPPVAPRPPAPQPVRPKPPIPDRDNDFGAGLDD